MSDENDFTDEGEGIKNLRKQYEQTQKDLKAAQEQLNEFTKAKRAETVAEILKAKGAPAGAAKLYNGEDASEDAVGKWLEDHADVFQITASTATSVTDENAQNAERVSSASYGSPSVTGLQASDKGAVLGNPEELMRLYQTQSREELQKLGMLPKPGLYGATP